MKKFLIKISILFLLLFTVFGGLILSLNKHLNNDANFLIDPSKDIIILGHSHPEGAFNDSIISKAINYSKSAEHYYYTYLKAKKLLKANPHIKTVFLELTNNHISSNMTDWIYDEKRNAVNIPIYSSVMNKEDQLYIFNKTPIAYFKSQGLIIQKSIKYIKGNKKNIPLEMNWGNYFFTKRNRIDSILNATPQKSDSAYKFQPDYSNLKFIDKIDSICKINNVKLILVRSPLHKKYPIFETEGYLMEVVKTRFSNIPFLDFSNFHLLDEDFGDLEHLNYKGAKKFSLFFNELLLIGLLEHKDPQQMVKERIEN